MTDPMLRRMSCHRQGSYKFNRVVIQNAYEAHVRNEIANAMVAGPMLADPTPFLGEHSVHATSVVNTANNSLTVIRKYLAEHKISPESLSRKTVLSLQSVQLFYRWVRDNDLKDCVNRWINVDTTHSTSKLTYIKLLEIVWAVFYHKYVEDGSKDMSVFERLKEELLDARGMCFMGQYNRLINSLVGIVPGVIVGITDEEQIKMSIQAQIAKYTGHEGCHAFRQLICFIWALRDEQNTTTMRLMVQPWIDAVLEMCPEPEPMENDTSRRITWDNLILVQDQGQWTEVIGVMEEPGKPIYL